jgi:hypothetical protein
MKPQILHILVNTAFRPFGPDDYEAFGGVEGDNPRIGEFDNWVVVVADDLISLINDEGREMVFSADFECIRNVFKIF